MQIWLHWWSAVAPLRAACSRERSFLWLAVALAGFCTRGDLFGVSSTVRALGLVARCYDRLLDFFHSPSVDVGRLARAWARHALSLFPVYRCEGRPVLLGDGIKAPKSGRKMPAVKKLHQESDGNTKPAYIMGHSIQVVSMLAGAGASFFAVPLCGRIHEGVKFTNRDKRTLPGKFFALLASLDIGEPFTLVADAYYACGHMALGLLAGGCHLASRVRRNAVAYLPPPTGQDGGKKRRGRPPVFGEKIRLWSLFDRADAGWQTAESPVYGESGIEIRLLCRDLLWRPLRGLVRYVLVDHPTRGRLILVCTDTNMPPIRIIGLYGLRFKIELSFKQALRVLGVYTYHFWMRRMEKLPRNSGTQHLHRASEEYRTAVRRKMDAYHRHIQIGLVVQGILQYLATAHPRLVWASFGSWLRTIRPGVPPSEFVVATALAHSLPRFLADTQNSSTFKKFLCENMDNGSYEGFRLTG